MLASLSPTTLTGPRVQLQPLGSRHADDLANAVGDLHQLWVTSVPRPEKILSYIRELLTAQDAGLVVPFAIVDRESGRAIGCTRYMNIRREHHGLEIGGTWLSASWQRTHVNTEAKYLLLGYAFERLGCVRVEFKTDLLNERSQRALERIGATREGVLRRHMLMPNGRVRDSVYYSIVDTDWPKIKTGLEAKLRTHAAAPL